MKKTGLRVALILSRFETKGLQEDMKRILEYITRYSPQEHELNPELKPFIPELIPGSL